jgi:hypothetical protein
MHLQTYKSGHKGVHALKIELDTRPPIVHLCMVQVGDTFLREGAVCMRVKDDCINGAVKDEVRHEGKIVIINLQTGNVWPASGQDEVFMIDAKLVITKVYKQEV